MSRGKKAIDDIVSLFKARNTLLWIVTREEARVEDAIQIAAARRSLDLFFWDCARGVATAEGKPVSGQTDPMAMPAQALDFVRASKRKSVWIFRDLHLWLRDMVTLRTLRSLARDLAVVPVKEMRVVIVLSPSSEVPPELAGHATVIDWPLPDREDIAEIVDRFNETLADDPDQVSMQALGDAREAVIDAAVGLTSEEAENCLTKSCVTVKRIDSRVVAQEKKRVIDASKVLEWFEPDPRGLDAVGGCDILKKWLVTRKATLTKRARDFGIPVPKGLMLVGPTGVGKSLVAKAVATAWQIPLLRLDMGALKSKYVGESEQNIRKALRVAEAVAPIILWIDEIEKAFAGATQGGADGGVSVDALGTILTWLQERSVTCFVVATANSVAELPPELLRRGRFDEIFFIDLPSQEERESIFVKSLAFRNRKADTIDVVGVTEQCEEFSGSEIATLIDDALLVAFDEGERPLTTQDLLTAAANTTPASRTSAEKVRALREWKKNRARDASSPPIKRSTKATRVLDLSDSVADDDAAGRN